MADFYLDHDVSIHVAPALRLHGHGAVTSRDHRQESALDPHQLLTATRNGWTLVSHNRKDFELLHDAWRIWSSAWSVSVGHAGILIIPHGTADRSARLINDFTLIYEARNHGEMHEYRSPTGWVQYSPPT